jgi:hypothetical protein
MHARPHDEPVWHNRTSQHPRVGTIALIRTHARQVRFRCCSEGGQQRLPHGTAQPVLSAGTHTASDEHLVLVKAVVEVFQVAVVGRCASFPVLHPRRRNSIVEGHEHVVHVRARIEPQRE